MDFTQFDARAAGEKAQAMDIMHPSTGAQMFSDGEPCQVLVIGMESRTAQAALAAVKRAKATETAANATDNEAVHADLIANVAPLIAGFKNVSRGDVPATAADAAWFLGLQMISNIRSEKPSFVEQVLAFANGRANFLGKGPKG